MKRAVFLDRDGTLIAEKNYLCRSEDVEIFPATRVGLKRLCDAGFKLFIVSNQSGVGRGYFTLAEVGRVNEHLARELARRKVTLNVLCPGAVAASRHRSFCSTRGMNLIWTWNKVL